MSSQPLELDAVINEVGSYGPYQARLFAAVLIPVIFTAIYNSQYVFNAADVNYRCAVPECESPPLKWEPGAWADFALVEGSRCERHVPTDPDAPCQYASFEKTTQRCDAWVYEKNNTIITEFNLACQDIKRTLVGTVHSIGVLTSLLFIGVVSDLMGRRITFILSSSLCAVAGLARSFVTSYYVYLVFEYLDAVLGAGVCSTGFILVLETVGVEKRVWCSGILFSVYALGLMVLALIAWAVPYWRTLTIILYSPSIFFLLYFLFLEESFRWLIVNKKQDTAIKVLRKIAAVNRRTLSDETVEKITKEPVVDPQKPEERSVFYQAVRSRILLTRVAICSFSWITSTFVYYGLSINSVSLAGNMYVNYMLISLVEIPGYLLSVMTLDRYGRRRSMMFKYFICGVSLVVIPLVPAKGGMSVAGVIQVSLAMIGKMSVSAAFNSLFVYTSELFPTSVRHRALAVCSLVARIGQIVAMLTPLLMAIMKWLPFLLFGCMAFMASVLQLLIPETLNKPLPDTVEQAERLDKPHK